MNDTIWADGVWAAAVWADGVWAERGTSQDPVADRRHIFRAFGVSKKVVASAPTRTVKAA